MKKMSGKSPILLLCGLCFICFSPCVPAKKTVEEKAKFHKEVKDKCGFSLEEIHDCKRNAVFLAIQNCSGAEDLLECTSKKRSEAIIRCEAPLNKHLTKEEVCLGDGIIEVTTKCKLPQNLDHLEECKLNAYVQVKRKCFEPKWKEHITKQAKSQKKEIGDEALECTYKRCFNDTEKCLREKHKDTTMQAAKFSIEHCAHIDHIDNPEACEKPGCAIEIRDCIEKHPMKKGSQAMVIAIIISVAVLLVVVLVALLVHFLRKRKAQSG
uniref:uncharacterized protein n=1 Tax=Myxine glutinosa TaxID=7769 RepID=UPI00358FFB4E